MWGAVDRLPHDLGHYLTEAWFRPPFGFWSLLEQQTPFRSLTVVRGRWPQHARERWHEMRQQHQADMLKAEATDLSAIAERGIDLRAAWPEVRRVLQRSYVFGPDNPFADVTLEDLERFANRGRALKNLWRRVPHDGALRVYWPPRRPEVLDRTGPAA